MRLLLLFVVVVEAVDKADATPLVIVVVSALVVFDATGADDKTVVVI